MPFLSKRATTPSPQSEAGRHLRCRGSGCLYREAQTGRDRPGRSLRRDRFCHGLPADREPCLGAIDPDLGGTYRRDGDRTTMPRGNVRDRLGRVTDADVIRLDRALLVFLGLAE